MGKIEVDDRFKKFGTVSFTSVTKINDFIQYLEDGKMMTTKCSKCGRIYFPPRSDCSACMTSEFEWFEVTGNGKLMSYSKLEYGPVGFEEDLPYSIAIIDYGDFKIFGRISGDVPEDEVKIGMELKTVANTLPNGQLNYVFQKV